MRRFWTLFAALSLVLAACGDDDSSIFTSTTAPESTTSTSSTTTPATTTDATTSTTGTTTTTLPTTTTTEPTTTTTQAPVTIHPGLPTATSRSLIPWSEVDEGWVVVLYDATPTSLAEHGPYVVYLVSPEADLYEIRAFTDSDPLAGELEAFSNDGKRVYLQMVQRGTFERSVASLSLETGLYRTVLDLGTSAYASLGSTMPTGRDVVVNRQDLPSSTDFLETYRTNGDLFGVVTSKVSFGPGFSWLYGLDGTFLVVGDGADLTVYGNTGSIIRSLDTPPGSCEPVRWWDASTILAACVPQDVLDALGYYHVLWLIPLDGSAGTPITAPPPPNWDIVEFGHANAWRAGGQTLLQWYGDCAARGIQVLGPGTNVSWLSVGVNGAPWIHAQDGDDLVVHSIAGCGDFYGPVSLIRPDGSLVWTLVPQIAGFLGVTSVAAMIQTP